MWKTVKLGEVLELQNGYAFKSKEYSQDGFFVMRITNVQQGYISAHNPKYVQIDSASKLTKFILEKGDIVVSLTGDVGRAGVIREEHLPAALNQRVAKVHSVDASLDRHFLFLDLNSAIFRNQVEALGKGAAQANVSTKDILEITLELPPLAEQQRIVAKLDAAFAEIDRAIELCEQKALNAEYIYANKLTQIFEEKDDDWTSCSLKEITSKIGSGATPRGGKAAYKEVGLSLIRSMNVYDMDFSWKELAKIDNEQAQKLSNVEVEQDDVLLNITGASVARCTIVPTDALPARVNQHVAIIRTDKSRLIPKLLAYGLVARINKETLLGVGNNAGATRQAITKRDIEEFVFSFPLKLDSQRKLTDVISNIKHEALKLEKLYSRKQENFIALKSAILAQELQPSQSEAA